MHALDEASEILGNQHLLAAAIGVSYMAVHQWKTRGVPIIHAVAIEKATSGAVTRKELRPDDWLSIWPELETTA